jgi:RimJ/RimL family protein N-acetyltransferase
LSLERTPTLESMRLRLVPLRPEHAALLFEPMRDPLQFRYIPADPPASEAELRARFERASHGSPEPGILWYNWLVRTLDDNVPVGGVQATVEGSTAHIAYWLVRSAQGRGYGREAAQAAIEALIERDGVTRIEARIDTRNVRSIRLVKWLGFRLDQTIKNADHFKGAPSDEYHFVLECPPRSA